MPLLIDDPEADLLAAALAERTGQTPAQAAMTAIREKLARAEAKAAEVRRMVEGARRISREHLANSLIDSRTPDEILGYDENGLST